MNLEQRQRQHDSVISLLGNKSASLDPARIPVDAQDQLLKGAQALAAGKTLGLSVEETLYAVSRQARADRRAFGPQREKLYETELDVMRQAQQLSNSLPNYVSEPANIVSSGFNENTPLQPDTEQTLRQGDRDFKGPEELARIEERDVNRKLAAERTRRNYEYSRERRGLRAFKNRPTTLVNDADSIAEVGFAPESAALRAEGDRRQKESVDALIASEAARLAPKPILPGLINVSMQQINEEIASRENALSFQTGGAYPRQPLAVNPRSGEMMLQTGAPEAMPTAVRVQGPFDASTESSYIDPRSGAPVEIQTPLSTVIAGSNTPNTGQMLNAPPTQSAVSYVANLAQAGTPFSRNQPMRQVAIGPTIRNFNENLQRTFPEVAEEVGIVFGLDPMQKATDAVLRIAGERGQKLGSVEGGVRITPEVPGVAQALDAIGLKSEADRETLAIAMQQGGMQGARSFAADQARPTSRRKVAFATEFDNPLDQSGFSRIATQRSDYPLARALDAAKAKGAPFDQLTFDRSVGATKEDLGSPRIRPRSSLPVEDTRARKQIDFLKESFATTKGAQAEVEKKAAEYLRSQGIENPTMGDVADIMMDVYQRREKQGSLARITRGPKKGQQKLLDRDAMERSIAESTARRPAQEKAVEDAAMAKLLRGPLRPGAQPADEKLMDIMERLSGGAS